MMSLIIQRYDETKGTRARATPETITHANKVCALFGWEKRINCQMTNKKSKLMPYKNTEAQVKMKYKTSYLWERDKNTQPNRTKWKGFFFGFMRFNIQRIIIFRSRIGHAIKKSTR